MTISVQRKVTHLIVMSDEIIFFYGRSKRDLLSLELGVRAIYQSLDVV